jgi:hypothetical protein
MTSPTPVPQQQTARAELVALAEKDVPDVATFIAVQSGRARDTVEAHLRWFLLENPARQSKDPLGFGLRSADQLVGCILCSPQVFCIGKEKVLLMGSSLFYVDERFRGYGGRVFLQYCRLGTQHSLFGTSANAKAAALWKAAGASAIPYSDGELFGVLRWPPIAEEAVHRRYSSRLLSCLAGTRLAGIAGIFRPLNIEDETSDVLRPLTSAEQVTDLCENDLRKNDLDKNDKNDLARPVKLTAARDLPYIRWRYFSGRDATTQAFAFRSNRPDQEIFIAVNQRIRGYREQIKTLTVIDVYPEVSPGEWLRIVGALKVRYGKIVDAIVLRNQNPVRQRLLCERGFQWRAFDAPNGWFLDRKKRLRTHDWYPVPADGDGLI